MKKRNVESVVALPTSKEELEALLGVETTKRQKLELESRLGKLKKPSDLVKIRQKIARIKTAINKQ